MKIKFMKLLTYQQIYRTKRKAKSKCLKRLLSTVTLMLITIVNLTAGNQDIIITGKVVDANTGDPLPGVNVIVKDSDLGTVTDIDGIYSVNVQSNKTLIFSFIGYLSEEIETNGQTVINVSLAPDIMALDEVVVVGYGVMQKSDITGSIVSVKEDDITAIPTTNALEVLQGKVSGLDLVRNSGQTGAGMTINIRGERSLIPGINGPLILVDGVEYGNQIDIHPNEIESIEVLKDASSTAIYGSRGANGVILITTKRGNKGQKVSFNAYYGSLKAVDYPEFFQGTDFIEFAREAHKTNGSWQDPSDDINALKPYELYDSAHFVDWRDLLIHDGMIENYHASVTGGNDKTSYMVSSFYSHEKGFLKLDEFKRYGGRLNLDHKLAKWAKIGASISYNYTDRDKRNNPLNQANKIVPVGIPYNEDGSINLYPLNDGSIISPLIDEKPGVWQNDEITKNFLYSAYLELEFLEGLKFKTSFSTNIIDRFEGKFADSETIERNGSSNLASTQNYSKNYLLMENILSYNKELGIHNFKLMAGNSVDKDVEKFYYSEGRDFPSNTFLYYNMNAAQSDILNKSAYEKVTDVSFFGRVHYKLLNKYILQLTLRGDGASTLADGKKWDAFPSASFAWRVDQEKFMENIDFISDFKFKASYGTAGKRSIEPYKTQGLFNRSIYTWGGDALAAGFYPYTVSNHELRWEKTATTNLGFDLSILRNRLNVYFDVYKQYTKYILMERQLPTTTGYSSIFENVGETENKGMEITLGSVNLDLENGFRWTTDVSFSINKDKIIKLNQSYRDLVNKWFEGYPISVLFSYEKIGIWQREDSVLAASYKFRPGDIRIKDYNNDGKITAADKVVVGKELPTWTGGMKNNFSFKGIDLSVFIYARIGQTIEYDGYGWQGEVYEGRGAGVKVDYWTYDNPTNDFPRPDRGAKQKTYNEALKFVDGSFIKIRDITLGYTIPQKWSNKILIDRLHIYTTLKNYFTIYGNVPGYDTERGGDMSYPLTKHWLFGVNADF